MPGGSGQAALLARSVLRSPWVCCYAVILTRAADDNEGGQNNGLIDGGLCWLCSVEKAWRRTAPWWRDICFRPFAVPVPRREGIDDHDGDTPPLGKRSRWPCTGPKLALRRWRVREPGDEHDWSCLELTPLHKFLQSKPEASRGPRKLTQRISSLRHSAKRG